jgi:hypothetical protein
MDKVAEFYARWFAKKRAPDYSDAGAALEELANDLLVCTSQTSEISGKVAL